MSYIYILIYHLKFPRFIFYHLFLYILIYHTTLHQNIRTNIIIIITIIIGSPNQHGFEEYISELDGPESARYTFLHFSPLLHSKGHRHLLHDDVPRPILPEKPGELHVLSDHEAGEAITIMRKIYERNKSSKIHQPWFIQVWFNAPHSPWQVSYICNMIFDFLFMYMII